MLWKSSVYLFSTPCHPLYFNEEKKSYIINNNFTNNKYVHSPQLSLPRTLTYSFIIFLKLFEISTFFRSALIHRKIDKISSWTFCPFTRNQVANFDFSRFECSHHVYHCPPSFAYAEDMCRDTLVFPLDLQRKQGSRSWAPRAARDPATPRNKTAEASRRRSLDGEVSVKSDHPWRTQATAPPLLGLPPRSPEETVPPPAILPRRRKKPLASFLRKNIATLIRGLKYASKMPRVSSNQSFIHIFIKEMLNLLILKKLHLSRNKQNKYIFYTSIFLITFIVFH